MKFFLDSANLDEIREGLALGIEGVTTNPTSAAKTGLSYMDLIDKILDLDSLMEVSAQVTESDRYRMYEQCKSYDELSDRVIVKVPATPDGLHVMRQLGSNGFTLIKFNVTLLFSPIQALFAAKAGAYIVSPFLARTDDAQYPGAGFELIKEIRTIYDYGGFKTQILAASIRSVDHVMQAALAGAHICTMSLKVLKEVHAAISHPQTEDGLAKMLSDWNAAQPAAWDTQTR